MWDETLWLLMERQCEAMVPFSSMRLFVASLKKRLACLMTRGQHQSNTVYDEGASVLYGKRHTRLQTPWR